MSKIEQLRKDFNNKQKEFQTQMKEMLQKEVKALFESYPQVQSVSWVQYTPYFNDGEECVFGVRADYPCVLLHGEESSSSRYLDEDEGVDCDNVDVEKGTYRKYTGYDEAKRRSIYEHLPAGDRELFAVNFRNLIRAVGSDILKAVYGDHAKVTLTASGANITDYEHE